MSRRSTKLIKAVLAAVRYSGAESLFAPVTSSAGVIFMLHQVSCEPVQEFEPNRILKVTPDFLDAVVGWVLDAGFEVIALDAVRERLQHGGERPPFACFTFDDGYRDNRDHAYPIFKRRNLPFAIYAATDFADGRADLWWLTLEEVLRTASHITLGIKGEGRHFSLLSVAEKDAAYHEIYWWLRSIPEDLARAAVAELAADHDIDVSAAHDDLLMSWDDLRALAKDPLVTIGAHTMSHRALAKLSEAQARKEIERSVQRIERELGAPCRHFSYPYGCAQSAGEREFRIAAELGLETAVTTRKGLLHPEHAQLLTQLPRLSLNGDFQDIRYVKTLLSGIPFAVLNTLQRIAGSQMAA
jgi:peptidoglycan/xylan/chitin deacetylase (PgdA/CDA1 family)